MKSYSHDHKKRKVVEKSTLSNIVKMDSTEERLMLLFDNYKTRARYEGIIDNDMLHLRATTWKEYVCHHCFRSMELSKYKDGSPVWTPFFVLQRYKHNQFTKPLLIRLHDECMKKLIWKIATKQAYCLTIFPKDVRSIIRDILLYKHRSQLKEVAKV